MRKLAAALVLVLVAAAAAFAFDAVTQIKLPKCSKKLCQDVGCAADFYCAAGAHVKSCADVCNGN
jgi:hypothetical protein